MAKKDKEILLNLKDIDNNYYQYEDEDENANENLSFLNKIDNFIDNNFGLLLGIGIPIFILNFIIIAFWILIYLS